MGLLSRILRRDDRSQSSVSRPAWRSVGDGDMSDTERAMYELAINSSLRSGEPVLVQMGDDGVFVDGKLYDSLDAAIVAQKGLR